MNQKDYMTIGELAAYLGWSARFIEGLARVEKLPGLQVDGKWRFRRDEIVDWLDQKIHTLETKRLAELDRSFAGAAAPVETWRISERLDTEGVGIDVDASNKAELIVALLLRAEATGKILDRAHLHASILEREALCSTAFPGGVAICHPRRPAPFAIGGFLLAFVRARSPISFGAQDGEPTSLFFLLCAPDDASHLHGLARLARMLDANTLAALRAAGGSEEIVDLLGRREDAVLGPDPAASIASGRSQKA